MKESFYKKKSGYWYGIGFLWSSGGFLISIWAVLS